ncbi:MAG: hypothetical protein JRH20_17495, partial [Deltaproteobacteria bacterium]|nr:hypothetical protein [Deltaproteobacteria bacterium]
VFALIEGNRLVAVEPKTVALGQEQTRIALGYGGDRFLRCTDAPETCQLIDATNARPLGEPIVFYSPLIEPPHAVLWKDDRFWVAAGGASIDPFARVLGWVDGMGQHGQELLFSRPGPAVSLDYFMRYSLHSTETHSLLWVDNLSTSLISSVADEGVIMRLTPDCP